MKTFTELCNADAYFKKLRVSKYFDLKIQPGIQELSIIITIAEKLPL